jgi:hypothetical protein
LGRLSGNDSGKMPPFLDRDSSKDQTPPFNLQSPLSNLQSSIFNLQGKLKLQSSNVDSAVEAGTQP